MDFFREFIFVKFENSENVKKLRSTTRERSRDGVEGKK